MPQDQKKYDCIIIGAGPGGLQAGIHLGRYNRNVLLIDKGGGRTRHAKHIENYLGIPPIIGDKFIKTGIEKLKGFNVPVLKGTVEKVTKENDEFKVHLKDSIYTADYLIAASGGQENIPQIKNLGRHWGKNFHTCVDCDGYRTTGKKLLLIGNSMNTLRLAFAMQEMFTKDISILAVDFTVPEDYLELLQEDDIPTYFGKPKELIGDDQLRAVLLEDGRSLECTAIMAGYGYSINDNYLSGMHLEKDAEGKKLITNSDGETSVAGLYATGALRQAPAQAIIAAGQGAQAAIEINKRLLTL